MTAGEAPPGVTRLGMPKWGLSMREGKVTDWLVDEGEEVAEGEELFEVETEKIDGAVESPAAGVLRRRVAQVGAVVPVGGLVGVLADPSVPDADVDAFVAAFQASFVPEEAEAPTRTVEVGGRRLRYLERAPEAAAGDPVVLLHGFGGDLNNWLFNTDKLAERRRVYALDLPGHGESSKDVGAGDLEAFAEALGGFLDAVGAARAHLVGHSMGGAVALTYALAHPDRVASLTWSRRPAWASTSTPTTSTGSWPPSVAASSRACSSCSSPTRGWSAASWSTTCCATSAWTAWRRPCARSPARCTRRGARRSC